MENENLNNTLHGSSDTTFSDEERIENRCFKCNKISKYPQTNPQIFCNTNEKINNVEIENMMQQLKINEERVKCLMKTNCQLQSELNKSVQSNVLMEHCITSPYVVKEDEMEFPGKSDLDKRFDCLFKALINIQRDLETYQNINYLANELDKIIKLPLPRCQNNYHTNFNEK